ncbi:hypothetical protein NBRC10513_006330 [Rhodotorula toruloides]
MKVLTIAATLLLSGTLSERCSAPCSTWLSSISSCGTNSSSNSTASCLCETPAVKDMISCASCIGAIETDYAKNASNNCAILTGHNMTDSGNGVEGRVGASLFALGLVGVAVLV